MVQCHVMTTSDKEHILYYYIRTLLIVMAYTILYVLAIFSEEVNSLGMNQSVIWSNGPGSATFDVLEFFTSSMKDNFYKHVVVRICLLPLVVGRTVSIVRICLFTSSSGKTVLRTHFYKHVVVRH